MKIIADENIPCVEQAFASLGDVTLVNGRSLTAGQVRDADVLLVRSVTRVDRSLLDGSSVRFVGSATIGFDHIDRDYLSARETGFSTAPGSNATSAAEYVVSSLLALSQQRGFSLQDRTVGIIGCGNVGSRVRQKLSALGMRCLVNDPPRQMAGEQDDFADLDEVLQADVVTLHVPYTRGGRWPTHHLIDHMRLLELSQDVILVNTSRGAAIDNSALNDWLAMRPDAGVVLDVWEGEPSINTELMRRVALATPHIAGYSLDGKLRGTEMIYRAACAYFGIMPSWQAAEALPLAPLLRVDHAVSEAVFGCYDVREDDARLRAVADLPTHQQAAVFDRLRREYPVRREFAVVRLQCTDLAAADRRVLEGLGFTRIESPDSATAACRAGGVTCQ